MYTDGIEILTFADIRAMYPNTSFPPQGPSETWLNNRGLYFLVETPQPSIDWDEVAYEDGVEEVSGEWRLKWSVRDKTTQEIEEHHEMIFNAIANHTDSLINVEITTNLPIIGDVVLMNDDRTKTALASKKNTMSNETDILTMAFDAQNGWFDLNYGNYQDLEVSLDVFTQSIFDVKRIIVSNHHASPYKTIEDAINDFNDELGS